MEIYKQKIIVDMELQRVNRKQAKLLKKLGYDLECDLYYSPDGELIRDDYRDWLCDIAAPTVALVLEWCRTVKGIECSVCQIITHTQPSKEYSYTYNSRSGVEFSRDYFASYKESESVLLDTILEKLCNEK